MDQNWCFVEYWKSNSVVIQSILTLTKSDWTVNPDRVPGNEDLRENDRARIWYLWLKESGCITAHACKSRVLLPCVPQWIKAATPRCNVAWKHRQQEHKTVAIDKHNGSNALVVPLRQSSLDSFQQTNTSYTMPNAISSHFHWEAVFGVNAA